MEINFSFSQHVIFHLFHVRILADVGKEVRKSKVNLMLGCEIISATEIYVKYVYIIEFIDVDSKIVENDKSKVTSQGCSQNF